MSCVHSPHPEGCSNCRAGSSACYRTELQGDPAGMSAATASGTTQALVDMVSAKDRELRQAHVELGTLRARVQELELQLKAKRKREKK